MKSKNTLRGFSIAVVLPLAVLALVRPLRADNPPTYLFEIDSSAVPGGFSPIFMAPDRSNNVYVTAEYNRILKFGSIGNYLIQWGGYGTNNGQFNSPQGIAVDRSNNVYVADSDNSRVEKFDSNGNFLKQWGSYGTNNGQFRYPEGIAVDASNNVYVADYSNNRVEKFDSDGNYLSQWGGYGTNNGQFQSPLGIAVDGSNNVYVTDNGYNRVEKFDSNGAYLTQWGSLGTNNGQFEYPNGIAVDGSNNVYVADSGGNRVEKFDSNGNYRTQWGQVQDPSSIAVDGSGNFIYVADPYGLIQVFVCNTNIVQPIITSQPSSQNVPVGTQVTLSVGVVGTPPFAYQWLSNNVVVPGATNAIFMLTNVGLSETGNTYSVLVTNSFGSELSSSAVVKGLPPGFVPPTYLFEIDSSAVPGGFAPRGLALDSSNEMNVADGLSNRIVKLTRNGTFLTRWGGYGTGNGQFRYPEGVAVDAGNNVYVADSGNARVEKFDRSGNYLMQWGSYGTNNGQFNGPAGIAMDCSSNVYVADYNNNRVEKFDSNLNYLTQWGSYGTNNGQFNGPDGIAVDTSNNVYVTDYNNNRIEKFDSNGNYLTQWGSLGTNNGQFVYPNGVAVDGSNNVYVVDYENIRVEKFDSNGNYLTQWVLSGAPTGIALDSTGNYVYVVETYYQAGSYYYTIQVFVNNANIVPPIITNQPASQTIPAGTNLTLSVSVVGTAPFAYQWYSNNVPLPGATSASFTLTNTSSADSATYFVLVTNSYGSAVSSNAVLDVEITPTYLFAIAASVVPGGFYAWGVAVDASHNLYVTDANNSRVLKFTGLGTYLTQWGNLGTNNGQFNFPQGIAVDSSTNVYVADRDNSRVDKFDSNGNYLTQWGSPGTNNGQFIVPNGIAVDRSNNVYVGDTVSNRVEKFDSNGSYLSQWGSFGSGNGQFYDPLGIALDGSNNVYVADQYNDRVEKFDSNGNYLTQWDGIFDPAAIAVDSNNNVYVAYLDGFQKFTDNGRYLAQSILQSNSFGYNPTGIAVDSSRGFIYVANVYQIQVFAINPNIVPPFIISQPVSQIVPAGINVAFSVGVVGTAPLASQWISSSGAVPGATNTTLTLSNVSLAASGNYALLVTNNFGSAQSSNATLAVLPALLTNLPVSGISATSAVLNASVTLGPEETLAWFEWGPDTNYGQIAGPIAVPGGSGTVTFSNAVSGLDANLTYHYRVVAWNSFGIVYGADQPFQIGLAPTALTLGGTDISTNGATLLGIVNPQGPDTTAYFRWGATAASLHNQTPATNVGSGVSPLNVSIPISGLTTGRVYFCQIVASNYLGTVSGAILGFPTGPWTQTTAPPIHNWDSVATSADGTIIVAAASDAGTGGPIYTSTNSGATWAQTSAPLGPWASVACSADGTQLVVAGGGNNQTLGPIYRSTNSGVTWTQTSAPSNNWSSVASSADGTKLAAADSGGERIYTSTNSGATWAQTSAPSNSWSSVAASADGTKLVAVSASGQIYTSTDSGATWVSRVTPYEPWSHVSSSADGATLLAVAGGFAPWTTGAIYSSTDSGATWVYLSRAGIRQWIGSSVSADGTRMAAVAVGVGIYTSADSGATWLRSPVPNLNWNTLASSADGAFLVTSVGYPATGGIYTWRITPAPQLHLGFSQGNLLPSWIIPSMFFGLQQNSDLTTTNWTGVTNLPVLNLTNLHNQVVLPPAAGNSFFRLKH
jgi:DNA-binding beta-propeller fold protein YncE